jgi:hypothetical protein
MDKLFYDHECFWTNCDFFGGRDFSLPSFILLTVMHSLTYLLWLLPIVYGYWTTILARLRTLLSAPHHPFMQVASKTALTPISLRRYCEVCQIFQADTEYHCDKIDICLPFYDHWCYFTKIIIRLPGLKAYLLFLVFLPIHQVFNLVLCVAKCLLAFRHLECLSNIAHVEV